MIVSRKAFEVAQEEIRHLRRELDEAQGSLARYKSQERDLLEALVSAHAEARRLRTLAEGQARELVDRAREQVGDAEARARELIAGARAEADSLEARTRQQLASLEDEISRLRDVQRGLMASLQQSLAALGSVTSGASALEVFAPEPRAAGPVVSIVAPSPLAPPPPQLAAWLAEHRRTEQASQAPPSVVGVPRPRSSPAGQHQAPRSSARWRERVARVLPSALGPTSASRRGAWLLGGLGVLACVLVIILISRWPPGWFASAARLTGSRATGAVSEPGAPVGTGSAAPAGTREGGSPLSPRTRSGNSPLTVVLHTARQVWLRAEVDGRTTLARTVRAGEDFELRGSREIVLRAGDAGAVLIGVNGKTPVALGRNGAVITRRVTAETPALRATTGVAPPAASRESRPAVVRSQSSRPAPEAVLTSPAVPEATDPPAASPQSVAVGQPAPESAAATPLTDDETVVLQGHDAYVAALTRGDASGISRLAAEGYTVSGLSAEETSSPWDLTVANVRIEVRGVGAIVSGLAIRRHAARDGQSASEQPLRFSEVWIKSNGAWQLLNARFEDANVPP